MSRDGRFSCSFVLHIKNPLFVRCILYITDSWVSSEISYHEGTKDDGRKTQDARFKTKDQGAGKRLRKDKKREITENAERRSRRVRHGLTQIITVFD